MEYQSLFSFPNLLTFLFFLFMIIWRLKTLKKSKTLNLPPSPWKLPLIGNMHHLVGSQPHRRFTDLTKKYGPLMHLQLGEISTVVISSAEAAKEVMKYHDINFAQRPKLVSASYLGYNSTGIVFSPYGDYWRQLRKLCALELLSAKRVQSFRSVREEEVSNFITHIRVSSKNNSTINLTKLVSSLTNDITARAAFGVRCKDRDAFLLVVQRIINVIMGFSLVDVFPSIKLFEFLSGRTTELESLHQEIDRILENIINEHRAENKTLMENSSEHEVTDDIVTVLLNHQKDTEHEFPLTNDNVKAVIIDVFAAGTETSSTTLLWAMSELVKNPRAMKMAQAEVRQVFDGKANVDEKDIDALEYLKLVVKETLRLHPPLPFLVPRECRERCMINGYEIPVGTQVIVNAWAIERDPNQWTEPESFYPERFLNKSIDYKGANFEFIPFGAGRRMCPGISFGIANVELPLAHLLYYFNWEVPNEKKSEDLDMAETFGMVMGRKNDLCLIPIPYHVVHSG